MNFLSRLTSKRSPLKGLRTKRHVNCVLSSLLKVSWVLLLVIKTPFAIANVVLEPSVLLAPARDVSCVKMLLGLSVSVIIAMSRWIITPSRNFTTKRLKTRLKLFRK
jgi:hypothetical protein